MTILMCLPKEILDSIEQVRTDCKRLKKENGLTAFGEGQLQLANILVDIVDKWEEEKQFLKKKI